MSDPRDTQFATFANLLFDELLDTGDMFIDTANPHWKEEWKQLIAQRAYDLVGHALIYSYTHGVTGTREEAANQIPDLTELPKVSE